jgi:hypothetical protein
VEVLDCLINVSKTRQTRHVFDIALHGVVRNRAGLIGLGLGRVGESDLGADAGLLLLIPVKAARPAMGLGVLASDTIRAATDMGLSLVALTLRTAKAVTTSECERRADRGASRGISRAKWPEEPVVTVFIEGRPVATRAWRLRHERSGWPHHTNLPARY